MKSALVTFCALDGDPYNRMRLTGEYIESDHDDPSHWGPTLRTLAHPRSPFLGKISDVYYLCHPARSGGSRRKGASAQDIAPEMLRALERHIPSECRPQFHAVRLAAVGPPNDHSELFDIVVHELRAIRARHIGTEVVLQLGAGTAPMHAALLMAGSVGVIDGPIRIVQAERGQGTRSRPDRPTTEVTLTLDTVLRVARRTVARGVGADEAPTISLDQARSEQLRAALAEAYRAAQVPFPVLLRGERGVGKSTIAQLIRAAGPYRKASLDKAWPSVACGQFTDPDRLTIELCGSVKGAFTGAQDRWGLLKQANGDTLFLDEIQDLDPRSQRAIIRVIESGSYYRLGEDKPSHSRFRLICGTNQPNRVLLTRLGLDFYDRIRDIEIWLPPLRECREDLSWMWREAWSRIACQCNLEPQVLSDESNNRLIQGLREHPLPGNWRDLRRIAVKVALVLRDGGNLRSVPMSKLLPPADVDNETACPHGATAPARLANKRDATHYQRLEAILGSGLSSFWRRCASEPPAVVLQELLGDRHRAKRAMMFIRRVHSGQWRAMATHVE